VLDRRVGRDLLGLGCELGLGVLQLLLGLAGAAQHVQRTLGKGGGTLGRADDGPGGFGERVRARQLDRLNLPADPLDATLDLASVALRFR
jgi:hypothetical protein